MYKKPLLLIISFLFILILSFVIIEKPHASREITFAPLFQILGKFVQTADASFSRILAVGEWDEADFGAELKERFDDEYETTEDSIYLNKLVKTLSEKSRKSFDYKVYVVPYMSANAYAMAGGAIVVAADLLDLLDNEAQIASIMAHEIAHVELDHCVNAVKFELAAEKYNFDTPYFFTQLYDLLLGISFSKTEEDEADDYAFSLIVNNTPYWPEALSNSFQNFIEAYGESGDKIILEEFFQSHPDMEYRRDKYRDKADHYKGKGERYVGLSNLDLRLTLSDTEFEDEWEKF